MNADADTLEQRARQRLLDVALGEAMGMEPPDVVESVIERLTQSPAPEANHQRRRHLLTAALVLLGVAATVWIAASREEDRDVDPATDVEQDPVADLPPPLRVTSLSQIPGDVRNLRLDLTDLRLPDLAPVAELAGLERFAVGGANPLQLVAAIQNPNGFTLGDDAFASLARCPRLHTLVLRDVPGCSPGHLGPLADAMGLRRLVLDTPMLEFGAELANVIAEFSVLRDLELSRMPVDGAGLRRLAGIAGLRGLALRNVRITDPEALEVLASMTRLRSLALPGIDNPMLKAMAAAGGPIPGPILTPKFLAALPKLVELDLSMNPLDAEQIASLPRTIERLSLDWLPATGVALAEPLIAMPALTDLSLSFGVPSAGDELVTRLFGGKLFERLALRDPTPAVAVALADQVKLKDLRVAFSTPPGVDREPFDLGFVEALPLLERLDLHVDERTARTALDGVDLAPLGSAARLKALALIGWPQQFVDAIRETVGDDVAVSAR